MVEVNRDAPDVGNYRLFGWRSFRDYSEKYMYEKLTKFWNFTWYFNISPKNIFSRIWHVPPVSYAYVYRVAPKKLAPFFMYAFTLPNINQFSKLFHCQNQEKICNDTVAKDPTTPQVCRYTTLWNVSVIKVTTKNKTTSVTTHFKKLTTGNNVFIVSVIV